MGVNLHMNTTCCALNVLSTFKDCSDLILNIFVIIGGVIGLRFINKQREKRMEASFGYMSRLSIHIKIIKALFEHYKDELLNQLLEQSIRTPREEFPNCSVEKIISAFESQINKTIEFLMSEDNQMPVYAGWTKKISMFTEFLESYETVFSGDGYIWLDDKDKVNQYMDDFYRDHKKNMEKMLDDIMHYQENIESKIAKKRKDTKSSCIMGKK